MKPIILLAVAVLALSGCAAAPAPKPAAPKTIPMAGTVVLEWMPVNSAYWWNDANTECHGAGDYASVQTGSDVIVADASGKTVQMGELGVPVLDDMICTYPFKMKVPAGSAFYKVSIAGKEVTVRKGELGKVTLTMGGVND